MNAYGTSEGAIKGWDTRGRGRNAVSKAGGTSTQLPLPEMQPLSTGAGKNGDWGASPDSKDGDCFMFATAVSQVTGWPMAEIKDDAGDGIHTVVVKPDGKLFDGSGTTSLKEVADKWDIKKPELSPLPKEAGEMFDDKELAPAVAAVKAMLGVKNAERGNIQKRTSARTTAMVQS